MSAERLVLACALAAALPGTAAAGAAGAAPARHAAAPAVQSMVVGAGGRVLSDARTATARAATVRVAHRSCAVAAGTPLAVLAALRRAGGPPFALRDYGRCGRSPADSGQLFVYSLGGQANRGRSGWEYKVDGVAGSTGAADPSGPRGNGRRLHGGVRVLWFWCQAGGRGCERTLEVVPAGTAVARNAELAVTVRGYDDEGHAVGVAGAQVTLGSSIAFTDASGHAMIAAPAAPGRYRLGASAPGLVPSFPRTIEVA
jgi:hypothetical protein